MRDVAAAGRYRLGVVGVVFRPDDAATASVRARAAGFEHIDVALEVDPATLALPVGCPIALRGPVPGWCTAPALPAGEGRWERTVQRFRDAPGCLLEPWAGGVVHSTESVREIAAAVPGLRFLIDTGHVADWGGDPLELLDLADHVQLRQGCPGHTQLHVDDPSGVVDFAAVIARLDALGYEGSLSIEHFDIPDLGWPLADPEAWAVDLAARVRDLLR